MLIPRLAVEMVEPLDFRKLALFSSLCCLSMTASSFQMINMDMFSRILLIVEFWDWTSSHLTFPILDIHLYSPLNQMAEIWRVMIIVELKDRSSIAWNGLRWAFSSFEGRPCTRFHRVVDCNEKTATMEIFISEIPRALIHIPQNSKSAHNLLSTHTSDTCRCVIMFGGEMHAWRPIPTHRMPVACPSHAHRPRTPPITSCMLCRIHTAIYLIPAGV